jgi:hypothetical protein
MLLNYDDITSRILSKPIWWWHGVPRYAPFEPRLATLHGDEVALVRSRCQMCGRIFDVSALRSEYSIRDHLVLYGSVHVGDPPIHADCGGNSQTSEQVELLEYWQRENYVNWRRVAELEGPLQDADDPSIAPKSMMQLVWAAHSEPQYNDAYRSENELGMADILSAAGLERPEYYARLLFAQKRPEYLRRLAKDELSFMWKDQS